MCVPKTIQHLAHIAGVVSRVDIMRGLLVNVHCSSLLHGFADMLARFDRCVCSVSIDASRLRRERCRELL